MTGKLFAWLAAAVVLAGGYMLALDVATGVRSAAESGEGSAAAAEPQIVLRGVEMVEARPEGPSYRFVSEAASYRILSGRISASGVTVALREKAGEIVVAAPAASWDMPAGRIDLDGGASAEDGRGWSAKAPRASVDLGAAVITAEEVRLEGPGVTVAGSNMRWRWHDGTVALDSPKSRILPAKVAVPGRRG